MELLPPLPVVAQRSRFHSSLNCTFIKYYSHRSVSTCTSYAGILSGTVDGVITLKNASGSSSLIITGGTEVGHAAGTYSHTNGYKVDVRHATTLDNYIHSAFTKIANRADGYPQWQAASGNIYCVSGAPINFDRCLM